jgi:nucleotidyltransferase substrate binding protein (TIGR01987 family)
LDDALTHLKKAKGLADAETDRELRLIYRTATIKSFEYAYALAIKLIERVAEERENPDRVAGLNFRNLIRAGWEAGLVRNNAEWDQFREMRNVTAHTYDAEKAAAIFLGLHEFIAAISHMLTAAEAREHAS